MAELFDYEWLVAGLFSFLALFISLCLIVRHLRNYTQPKLQRHIVRILLMVPIYSLCSWLSLHYTEQALYFDLVRDCYEAYVIYQFFNLLIAFINTYEFEVESQMTESEDGSLELGENMGNTRAASPNWEVSEDRVVTLLESKPPSKHPWPTCWFPPFKPGAKFLLLCKRCILQFVIIKPAMAILAAVLENRGLFGDGDFSPQKGYLYVTIVDNISITISMYFLVLFYHVTQKELKPFNPLSKFMCIKLIIMFAFWQGILISLLLWLGVFEGVGGKEWTDHEKGTALQNFIICVEMFFVAIAHSYAFGYESFRARSWTDWVPCHCLFCCCCCCCKVCGNLTHVVSQGDLVEDGVEVLGLGRLGNTATETDEPRPPQRSKSLAREEQFLVREPHTN